ncbi:hypothetical protein [Dysgonomonas sp. ZJ709]|uniref:hypothetical protein n=1 Tax=Dysgonomonas sp. ZJ709 TaxID=2709797 RepID=UPI0013EE3156|nr:hypothetical protein [Dysgonomonas sp. ZJ709]
MDALKDYFDQQKMEKIIEQELNVNRWVVISIGYRSRDNKTPDTILFRYDIPLYLKEKYNWVIRWRAAKVQCQHPKEDICTWLTNYDKRTSLRLEHDSLYTRIISAKAWLTRSRNKVKKYEEERKKTLFHDFEADPIWLNAMQKVKDKEQRLVELETILETEIQKRYAKAI